MKQTINRNWLTALLGLVLAGTLNTLAQQGPPQDRPQRGNFDPEQMRAQMMERTREALEVKGDDEWKAIEPMVTKVMEAQRDVGFGGMGRGMFGRGPRQGGDNAQQGGGQNQNQGNRRGVGQNADPDRDALEKAIESKASAGELKAAMTKVRESRKAKEAKLNQAREDLRKVLTVRQEAILVSRGLLN